MKARWTFTRQTVALGFIVTGVVWGASRELSVHAQQSAASATQVNSATTSGTPKLENGKLQVRTVTGSLADTINRWAAGTAKAEWLGYTVAEVSGDRSVCCWQDANRGPSLEGCGRCSLERGNNGTNISKQNSGDVTYANGKVTLEGPTQLVVLYRAESGRIGQIRVFSAKCTLDAGGLAVAWLEGVKSSDSVSVLETFVHGKTQDSARDEKPNQGALAAIALHADPSADRAMESFVATGEPVYLRKEAAFWLGEARGAQGLRILQKLAQSDPSPDVRDQVTFSLSISREPGALPELIRIAHEDQSSQVRGQALFWLGQKAGEKAAKAISGSIDNDPDTEVKKKAVFALSQMPAEQGVPKLIQVAQTNRNPQVRKEAMFWLGQSEDPQALAFFEKVLSQ
jgi:HEAT repeat protein